MGNALDHHRAGRIEDAQRIYQQILSLNSKHADSLHLLGMVAYSRGNLEDAVNLIEQAIAINRREAMYHSNLGNIRKDQGKLDEAIRSFRRALALNPRFVDAHNNLGIALVANGEVAGGIAHYEQAVALDPSCATALCNMGIAHETQGKLAEAVDCHQRALAMQPSFVTALYNLGNALKGQDRLCEAIQCYDRALALDPGFTEACNNLGTALRDQDTVDGALACYERAIATNPDFPLAHFGKALTQLLQGEFSAGWSNYEWRWKTNKQQSMRRYPQPLWNGERVPSGRLLLWGEQGLGDEIMFAGLIPDVLRSGTPCAVDCQTRLQPLFERSFPGIPLVSGYNPTQHKDLSVSAHLPTGSLPRLFRTSESSFGEVTSPYFLADPERRKAFRAKYVDGRKLIGLAWHTSNKDTGRNRSIALSALAPLLSRKDLKWVSLQYGDHSALEADVETVGASIWIDRSVDQMKDVDCFASQIAALDLVITIDNSTAHLAGALGVPVWVLLPFVPDWRWFRTREDSPWYPSMRLFRQPRLGDWNSVVERVAAEL